MEVEILSLGDDTIHGAQGVFPVPKGQGAFPRIQQDDGYRLNKKSSGKTRRFFIGSPGGGSSL